MDTKKEAVLKSVSEMTSLINFLFIDLKNSNELLGQNLIVAEKTNDLSLIDSLIRMRIKLVVSLFESTCYAFRQAARELCILLSKPIPARYSDLFNQNKKFELKDKIKLSFKFMAYAISGPDDVDVSSPEWKQVCELLDRRHHLTHPNSAKDLEVSGKDLEIVNESLLWFASQMTSLSKKEKTKIKMDINEDDIADTINRFKDKYEVLFPKK